MGGGSGLYLVTGGNSGLGLHTALELARQGKRVVIAARDEAKTAAAVARINAEAGAAGGAASGAALNLGDLSGVRRFVQQLLEQHPGEKIQGLVLNAGINTTGFAWSADGLESTWAINHLGHFLLAQLLLPHLAPDARIVVTSSGTHAPAVKAPLPAPKFDHPSEMAMLKSDLGGQPPAKFDGSLAYTRSKLSNVLFTYHLARTLQQRGSKVTVVAYDPGFCPGTDIMRDLASPLLRAVFVRLVPIYMWAMRSPQKPSTPEASGAFQARLAAAPEFAGATGKYYSIDREVPSSEDSYDEAKQAALWEYSEGLVKTLAAAAAGGEAAAGAVAGAPSA